MKQAITKQVLIVSKSVCAALTYDILSMSNMPKNSQQHEMLHIIHLIGSHLRVLHILRHQLTNKRSNDQFICFIMNFNFTNKLEMYTV